MWKAANPDCILTAAEAVFFFIAFSLYSWTWCCFIALNLHIVSLHTSRGKLKQLKREHGLKKCSIWFQFSFQYIQFWQIIKLHPKKGTNSEQRISISFRHCRTSSLTPQLTLKTECHAKADPKTLISPAVTGRLPKINALILRLPQKKELQTWPVTMATVISFSHGCQKAVHLYHVHLNHYQKIYSPPLVHNQSVRSCSPTRQIS